MSFLSPVARCHFKNIVICFINYSTQSSYQFLTYPPASACFLNIHFLYFVSCTCMMQQLLAMTTYKATRHIICFCYHINDSIVLQIGFETPHKTLFIMLLIRQATQHFIHMLNICNNCSANNKVFHSQNIIGILGLLCQLIVYSVLNFHNLQKQKWPAIFADHFLFDCSSIIS